MGRYRLGFVALHVDRRQDQLAWDDLSGTRSLEAKMSIKTKCSETLKNISRQSERG